MRRPKPFWRMNFLVVTDTSDRVWVLCVPAWRRASCQRTVTVEEVLADILNTEDRVIERDLASGFAGEGF